MRWFLAVSILLLVGQGIRAHEEELSAEQRAERLEQMETLLRHAFVQVETEAPETGRSFEFVTPKGERLYVRKSAVAEAVVETLRVAAPWLKAEGTGHHHCDGHCHHAHDEAKKITTSRWEKLQVGVLRLSGAAAEIASSYGIIPVAVVIATWPAYTLATEFLESLAVGPAHTVCVVSQVLYGLVFTAALFHTRFFKEVISTRGSSLGVWGRIRAAYRTLSQERKFNRAMRSIIFEELLTPQRQRDFEKVNHDRFTGVGELMAKTFLWADLWKAPVKGEPSEAEPLRTWRTDFDSLFDFSAPDLFRAREVLLTIRGLSDVVRKQYQYRMEQGELSAFQFVAYKRLLGRWLRQLDNFERGLRMAMIEPVPEQLLANRVWAEESYARLLSTLAVLSEKEVSRATVSAMLSHAALQVHRFSRGEFLGCVGKLDALAIAD